MDRVSRPLIALLLATVVFFALWTVALKPKSSDTGGSSGNSGLGQYSSAIQAAHGAVATANAASARHGGVIPTSAPPSASSAAKSTQTTATAGTAGVTAKTPPGTASHAATQATAGTLSGLHAAATATTHRVHVRAAARHARSAGSALMGNATPAQREQAVVSALRAHRVVAMLFFNPAAADDRALHTELASVPTHGGRVLTLAAPLSELSLYPVITLQVPVTGSPTLVVIDHSGAAITLVGFQDRFVVAQWVDDAYFS